MDIHDVEEHINKLRWEPNQNGDPRKFARELDEVFDKFVEYTWFYKESEHGGCPELAYTGLKLAGEAGETAEKIGKAYRDNNGIIADEAGFMRELGDVLFYVVKLAHLRGYKMSDVIKFNVEKLLDRKARGKMHGEGDYR